MQRRFRSPVGVRSNGNKQLKPKRDAYSRAFVLTIVMLLTAIALNCEFLGNSFAFAQVVPSKPQAKGKETQKAKAKQSSDSGAGNGTVQKPQPTTASKPVTLKGKVVWEAKLGGVAGTQPVLSDTLCVVSVQNNYAEKEDQTPRVVAVNRTSGKTVWEFPVAGSIPGQCVFWNGLLVFGIDESSKPATEAKKVAPAVIALDPATGKEKWRKSFEFGTGRGSPLIPRGEGSELIPIGNKIAVLNDGLVVLDGQGQVSWHKQDLKYDRITTDGSLLYAAKADHNDKPGDVVAIDPKDGSIKWRYELEARLIEPGRPVISGDQLLVATSSPANDFAQRFFSGTQYLICLNKTTGKLMWKKSLRWFEHGGGIQGEVFPLGQRVFLADVKGGMMLDRTSGERISTKAKALGFGTLYFPIDENTIFTGSEAFDLRTGNSLWKISRDQEHKHLGGYGSDIKPVVTGEKLYLGSLDGYLLCVD